MEHLQLDSGSHHQEQDSESHEDVEHLQLDSGSHHQEQDSESHEYVEHLQLDSNSQHHWPQDQHRYQEKLQLHPYSYKDGHMLEDPA